MTLLSKLVVDAGEFTEVKVDLQSTEGIKYLYKKKGGGGYCDSKGHNIQAFVT